MLCCHYDAVMYPTGRQEIFKRLSHWQGRRKGQKERVNRKEMKAREENQCELYQDFKTKSQISFFTITMAGFTQK